MSTTSKCRACQTIKTKGDVCPGCGAGLMVQRMRVHKGQPISIFGVHGIHSGASGVGRHRADGHYI